MPWHGETSNTSELTTHGLKSAQRRALPLLPGARGREASVRRPRGRALADAEAAVRRLDVSEARRVLENVEHVGGDAWAGEWHDGGHLCLVLVRWCGVGGGCWWTVLRVVCWDRCCCRARDEGLFVVFCKTSQT